MAINREIYFKELRRVGLFTSMSNAQVEGIETVLSKWELLRLTDLRWLAYMMGTSYHETDKTMQAIEEYGKGKNRPYGKKIKHSGVAYSSPDKIYYGRGLVQLTWYENYELMTRLLGVDLLKYPEQALDIKVATNVMFEGMLRGASSFGDFTGKCLEMYFNEKTEDWIGARKIINGSDKAQKIADESKLFLTALKLSA